MSRDARFVPGKSHSTSDPDVGLVGLVTIEEAAAFFGISSRSLRRWIADDGIVTYAMMGRTNLYLASDLLECHKTRSAAVDGSTGKCHTRVSI